jgi:hypothetical protein
MTGTAKPRGAAALQACMGGWCTQRDHCPNYHAEFRGQPSERLCDHGREIARVIPIAVQPLPSQNLTEAA